MPQVTLILFLYPDTEVSAVRSQNYGLRPDFRRGRTPGDTGELTHTTLSYSRAVLSPQYPCSETHGRSNTPSLSYPSASGWGHLRPHTRKHSLQSCRAWQSMGSTDATALFTLLTVVLILHRPAKISDPSSARPSFALPLATPSLTPGSDNTGENAQYCGLSGLYYIGYYISY